MLSVERVIERGPGTQGWFEDGLSETDERIAEQAYQALATSGYRLLRNLQVYCDHGRVTLQGRLPTYFLKQLAQSLIQRIEGVRDVDNDVRVLSCQMESD